MNDIINDEPERCIVCERQAGHYLCKGHDSVIERGWYVAQRTGPLERLIDAYKFENAKAAYVPLGELLLSRLPVLPSETIIVSIPTIARHVRQRGYDHMMLISRLVARRRAVPLVPLLRRQTTTTQRDAGRREREHQASEAFVVSRAIDPDAIYLLVDDVATTGATLRHAAQALRKAGARTVWVAAIARQPLD